MIKAWHGGTNSSQLKKMKKLRSEKKLMIKAWHGDTNSSQLKKLITEAWTGGTNRS